MLNIVTLSHRVHARWLNLAHKSHFYGDVLNSSEWGELYPGIVENARVRCSINGYRGIGIIKAINYHDETVTVRGEFDVRATVMISAARCEVIS